ncbi:hypothetical protein Q7A53_05165 [Halobacillus rhizosphaerae]|uniref:hypothetical protein n=1 Tax=Halobacillus rhizosphaerae TaxID=3064889 RepID=UPI00398A97EF
MKNCTKHFLERWAERVLEVDRKEINAYITKNKDQIHEHANTTFEYAQFIYKGAIGDNVTRNYYIKDDIVFVNNTTDDAFITTYKVDLGYPDELNATVRRELLKEIEKLTLEKDEADFKILEQLEEKEMKASIIEDEIRHAEEQLKFLKDQRDFAKDEINNLKKCSLQTGHNLKKYTMLLVNSKEYKSDLLSMK